MTNGRGGRQRRVLTLLHLNPVAADPGAIELPARVLRIPLLLHLHECKAWGSLSDPHLMIIIILLIMRKGLWWRLYDSYVDYDSGDVVDLSDAADFADSILDVVLVGVVWETADVDLSHWVHHS